MRHRTTSEITIRRPISGGGQQESVPVAAVPITANSKRKFTLMGEDSITLSFTLQSPIVFRIGDRITDELFGNYYLAKEHMPKYNTTTGAYDYDLTFEAEYMLWRNWLCCLTTWSVIKEIGSASFEMYDYGDPFSEQQLESKLDYYYSDWESLEIDVAAKDAILAGQEDTEIEDIPMSRDMWQALNSIGIEFDENGINTFNSLSFTPSGYIPSGIGQRTKCDWRLTDRLETHAAQIVANLASLGLGEWSLSITAEKAAEAHYIAYNGISLLDALNAIADTFECEWWVTTDNRTIHFGKCEGSGEPLEFTLGDNVESMDIQNNRKDYANRLYVFGSSRNIPVDYDKTLFFVANAQGDGSWADNLRPLTLDMFAQNVGSIYPFGTPSIGSPGANQASVTAQTDTASLTSGGHITGGLDILIITRVTHISYSIVINVMNEVVTSISGELEQSYNISEHIDINRIFNSAVSNHVAWVQVILERTQPTTPAPQGGLVQDAKISSSINVYPFQQSRQVNLLFGSDTYPVTFRETVEGGPMTFTFDDDEPDGFDNSHYSLSGLTGNLPVWYYTEDFYRGTLTTFGERRLHLPHDDYPDNYIDTRDLSGVPMGGVVEQVVIFEDIFPRVDLVITQVDEDTIRDNVTHEDGSETYEDHIRYFIHVEQSNGNAFNFSKRYMQDGEKLQGNFYAPSGATQGNLLAGMVYDLGFDERNNRYVIIRNEDYGMLLPNEILRPSVGDALTLSGWNPLCIGGTGVVSSAESALMNKGEEYAELMEEGQFTFTCHMMSDWPFSFITDIPLHTSHDEPVEVTDDGGSWLHVRNDFNAYRLPIEGARVTIHHDALNNGSKVSRVIGYEFKLDMPWDSPTYTIGETQAYSRLAKIEKEITKLS